MLVRETGEIQLRPVHQGCRRNQVLSLGTRQRTGLNNSECIGGGSSAAEEKGQEEEIDRSRQRGEHEFQSLLGVACYSPKLNATAHNFRRGSPQIPLKMFFYQRIRDGQRTTEGLSALVNEISEPASLHVIAELAASILQYAVDPLSGNVKPSYGLLYGLIQSGKTSVITITTAMAVDNGFKCIIVLTSDFFRLGPRCGSTGAKRHCALRYINTEY